MGKTNYMLIFVFIAVAFSLFSCKIISPEPIDTVAPQFASTNIYHIYSTSTHNSYNTYYGIDKVKKIEELYEFDMEIGDAFISRDGRIILDISNGQVIYKQFFFFDGKWMITTNSMPFTEFTNHWLKMEL